MNKIITLHSKTYLDSRKMSPRAQQSTAQESLMALLARPAANA